MTYRDDPDRLKLQETLKKIQEDIHTQTENLTNLHHRVNVWDAENRGIIGFLKNWSIKFNGWLGESEPLAVIWYIGRWGTFVGTLVFLSVVGGRAGCAYNEYEETRTLAVQNEEFCGRVCVGVGATYVGRNGTVNTEGHTDHQLSSACLCSRDNQVFPVNQSTGVEIHYVAQPRPSIVPIQVPIQNPETQTVAQ